MRVLLACLLMSGCVSKRSLTPEDTKFDPNKRNWIAIYQEEINIAIKNNDEEARFFFLQEIIKMMYYEEYGIELPDNPAIKIID